MSDTLDEVLKDAGSGKVLPLYLLAGDEFLIRKAADELVKALLPDAAAGLNLLVMDGATPREVAQELAMMPLFPGKKLVLVRDPEFVAPKKGRTDVLGRARDAWRSNRRKEAARRVLALAARAGWSSKELDPTQAGNPGPEKWKDELDIELGETEIEFLKEVAAFCVEEGITTPESDASSLVDVFAGRLPEGHMLVLVASDLDAKNPLVKLAKDKGAFIERKVAAKLKEVDLGELTRDVLAPFGKKLGPGAAEALKDRLGGNMRLVQSELEKVAIYVDGPVIQSADIALLVQRVREEEYLELSDAIQKRDLGAALRYVDDAMGNGSHPLMLLGAVASIVRNLLEAHDRLAKISRGGDFRMSFNDFKARVFPRIEEELKARKGRVPHPYALYAGMQSAARFSREQLYRSLRLCAETDVALKSSGHGRLSIERLLWTVCGAAA